MASNFFKWMGQKIHTYGNEERGHMLATVPAVTQLLHEGYCYDVSGTPTLTANGGTYIFASTTSSETDTHFYNFNITSDNGPVLIELIEDVTITDSEGTITPRNRNRQFSDNADMVVYYDATITGGTVIATRKITSSAQGSHTESGASAVNGEWCLKRDSNYAIRLTNQDTLAAAACSASFFFYEIDL
jgi:hypothetical protein